MKLSIADKLAILYTGAGSQRAVASALGVSHQLVGRILHAGAQGADLSRYESRPELSAAIEQAMTMQRDVAKQTAKDHGLPYTADIPLYAHRLELKLKRVINEDGVILFTGTTEQAKRYAAGKGVYKDYPHPNNPHLTIRKLYKATPDELQGAKVYKMFGDRVSVDHLHWVSDRLRSAWIERMRKTDKYYQVSVRSTIELSKYNKQANERAKQRFARGLQPRTISGITGQHQFKSAKRQGDEVKPVYTPYMTMRADNIPGLLNTSLNQTLQARHAPATGAAGTAFADQILLQLNTLSRRNDKSSKKGRAKRRK